MTIQSSASRAKHYGLTQKEHHPYRITTTRYKAWARANNCYFSVAIGPALIGMATGRYLAAVVENAVERILLAVPPHGEAALLAALSAAEGRA